MFRFSSSRIKFLLVFVLLVGGGYFAGHFLWTSDTVPKDFIDARLEGAFIAQNIVNLSNQSTIDVQKISELDSRGNFTGALDLTANVVNQSQEIRDEAVKLSAEIEKMTKSLSDINSLDARQAALESITNRLALISRLINYSGYLGQLLDSLHNRFSGTSASRSQEVQTLVGQINAEVRAINSFNSQAGQAMDRFDKIVSR